MEALIRSYIRRLLEVSAYTTPAHDHGYEKPRKPDLGGPEETFHVIRKKKKKKRKNRKKKKQPNLYR